MRRTCSALTAHALAAAALALLAPEASATVVLQPSLSEMTARSNLVLHAAVEDQAVTLDGAGRVITLTRLRVHEGLKGATAGDTVTLYQVGGRKAGHVARIAGMNEFRAGEEVVVFGARFLADNAVKFLQANRGGAASAATLHPTAGYMVVHGIGLGKFRVERPAGGVAMVAEELGDVAVARRTGNATQVVPAVFATRQPLDVFLDEVRRLAAQPGRAP